MYNSYSVYFIGYVWHIMYSMCYMLRSTMTWPHKGGWSTQPGDTGESHQPVSPGSEKARSPKQMCKMPALSTHSRHKSCSSRQFLHPESPSTSTQARAGERPNGVSKIAASSIQPTIQQSSPTTTTIWSQAIKATHQHSYTHPTVSHFCSPSWNISGKNLINLC